MKTRNIFLKTKKFYLMFFWAGIVFGFLIGFYVCNFLNYAKYQKEIQELMLILNTHAKLEKNVTYDKARKKGNFMERLDYMYGADRMMTFKDFDIHLLSYQEMKDAMLKQGIDNEEMFNSTIEIANKVEDYDIKDIDKLRETVYQIMDEGLRRYRQYPK